MSTSERPSQLIEFKVLGTRMSLRASDHEPEKVNEIVEFVTERLKEAEKRAPQEGALIQQVILLALLDLAEDYLTARTRTIEFKERIDARSTELLGLLEAELK